MAITHAVVKVPGQTLAAVADWNANHTISAGTILRSATLIVAASDSADTTNADYFCDGVADEVQINAAIAALPATGGSVVLMDGTFDIDASIAINKHNVSLIGQGKNTVIFTNTTIRMVDTSTNSSRTLIRDIYFKGVDAVGCYGIYLDGDYNIVDRCYFYTCRVSTYILDNHNKITNCHIYLGYQGVYITGAHYNNIIGCSFFAAGTGVYFYSASSCNAIVGCNFYGGMIGVRFNSGIRNTVSGNVSDSNGTAFCLIQINSHHNTINGNIIKDAGYAVSVNGADFITINGNMSRGDNNFVYLTNSDGCVVSGNTVEDVDGTHAITLSAGANHSIVGNSLTKIDRHGIYLLGSSHNVISGNSIHDCSEDSNNAYSGIYLSGTSTYNIISANRVSGDAFNKPKYGIAETTTADDYNNVTGNTCTDAQTANILIRGVNDEIGHNIAP